MVLLHVDGNSGPGAVHGEIGVGHWSAGVIILLQLPISIIYVIYTLEAYVITNIIR